MASRAPSFAEDYLRRVNREYVCDIRYTPITKQNMLTIFRHIAGFRDPDRFNPGEKFSDMTFVLWRLTRPPRKSGWEKDPTKWAW